jgi:membrane protease YdiL (CAAX protease family)
MEIEALGINLINWKKAIIFGLIIGFSFYCIDLIYSFFGRGPNLSLKVLFNIRNIIDLKSFLIYLFFFFWVFLLAPILEEIFFRGILYSPYRKKYGVTIAICITSIIFILFHSTGGNLLAPIIYCVLYEKYESLVFPIVAHSFTNLFLIFLPALQ